MFTERLLAAAFVKLAATLVEKPNDGAELLGVLMEQYTARFAMTAVGVLSADPDKEPKIVGTSEPAEQLAALELRGQEGPCVDAIGSSQRVVRPDLTAGTDPWPAYTGAARASGYTSVYAFPLRRDDEVVGAVALLGVNGDALTDKDVEIAHAMAEFATICMLKERAYRQARTLNDQLQVALDSRIVIEQAKGMLAERGRIDPERAFHVLREHARRNNLKLAALAKERRRRQGRRDDDAASRRARPGQRP